MNCPQCGHTMDTVEYEGVVVQSCNGCGGEFLGPRELGHIVRTREAKFGSEIRAELDHCQPIFGVPAEATERTIRCPSCRTAMEVVNYAGDTGVFVDRCPGCGGLWLDHEELEKVQALTERWSDEAPARLQQVAGDLETARRTVAAASGHAFQGSRFSFVNAVINRILDAA